MRALLVGLGESEPVVARMLAARGHTVVADVTDAASALDRLEGVGDLIVVGGRDSVTSCATLRNAPVCVDAVILALVDHEHEEATLDALLAVGADDFLQSSPAVLQKRLLFVERAVMARAARKGAESDRSQFYEMSHDLLCIAGLDGYFKQLNPMWSATLGWTSEELLSKPWLEFVHPDDRAATMAAGARLTGGSPVTSFANRYRCKDETYRSLDWKATASVQRGLIYAVARDVTEQQQVQAELRDMAETLSTTLNSMGDGVIACDVAGAVIGMNPMAEKLTGWTLMDAAGRALPEIFKIINGVTRATIENPVDRVLRDGAIVGLASHTFLVRRDGTELPIADSCAPLRRPDAPIGGAVLVFRDMTVELEARLASEKTQRKLVVAERMASVGTLAAGVAHEINNPLAYVIANLELALEHIRAPIDASSPDRMRDLEELVQGAQQGAERVRKIVHGLKTLSRAGDDKRSVIDLGAALDLSINIASNEIAHRARLVKDYGPAPFVEADEGRLGQVFINLLINAAQAIPQGHQTTNEIRVVTATDETGRAVVEVRDSGPGIEAAVLARIFDPFYTTKAVGVGTGLGLSICHSIVTGMGGEISVKSVPGRGTTFRVVLPAAEFQQLAARLPTTKPPSARRGSVLVVDDDAAVGISLGRVLGAHDVTIVTTANDALELVASGKDYDVILSDLMMPDVSGMDFYDELSRRNPSLAERVVFVTGGAFTTVAEAFLDRVTNERIEKPFDVKVVRAMVQRLVRACAASRPECISVTPEALTPDSD